MHLSPRAPTEIRVSDNGQGFPIEVIQNLGKVRVIASGDILLRASRKPFKRTQVLAFYGWQI